MRLSAPRPWEGGTIALLGLGDAGAAVARTLRRVDPGVPILGVEPDPVRAAQALAEGWVTRVEPSAELWPADTTVLVVSGPLNRLPVLLRAVEGQIPEGTLMTDALPLQDPLLRGAAHAGLRERWVTASPLPGGLSSLEAPDGCPVSLAADPSVPDPVRRRAEAFWQALGGVTVWEDAREHDARAAWVAHLPQLVATALAGALHAAGIPKEALVPEARAFVALAASDPAPWNERLGATGVVTGTGLTSVQRALGVVADLLARGHVERIVEFMERAQRWASDEGDDVAR
jgi:prephenate dehydrogenase